jgi:transposase
MTTQDGIPLAATITAAQVHDVLQVLPLVVLRFPQVGGLRGRPWQRPRRVTADKGYDSGAVRAILRWLGVEPRIARRGEEGFGAGRWSIERTLSWLKQYRRLRLRWDRSVAIYEAFLYMAFILIAWRFVAM